MRALALFLAALILAPAAALAVGSDDDAPPTPTPTSTTCEDGFVWDNDKAACVVADFTPGESLIPLRDSPFTSHGNEIAMFRGVTWLEPRPDLGPEHSIQYSAIPGFEIPETAVARCDFTDGFCVTSDQGAIVVRLALRPGWLELLEDREEVEKFFSLRGFA